MTEYHQDPQKEQVEPPLPPVRAFHREEPGFRWHDVPVLAYKPNDTHFQGITRQVLFDDPDHLACQLRYFEVQPGGYSSLEKHEHTHAVMILRGRGRVLIGEAVHPVAAFDLVYIPSMTWHQFRTDDPDGLGFLCLVPCDRDRPIRPEPADLERLRIHPSLSAFIRV
ncbi:MAG: cupin domain-containing protein [Rhodothermales bacterium]